MPMTKVKGEKKTKPVKMYALSTCGWCRRTKELLNKSKVEYEYCDVDELTGDEKNKIMAEVMKLNPHGSYPTIVIGGDVVVGFDEDRIARLLGL
jgi:glutaredoxin-like protein NrdH